MRGLTGQPPKVVSRSWAPLYAVGGQRHHGFYFRVSLADHSIHTTLTMISKGINSPLTQVPRRIPINASKNINLFVITRLKTKFQATNFENYGYPDLSKFNLYVSHYHQSIAAIAGHRPLLLRSTCFGLRLFTSISYTSVVYDYPMFAEMRPPFT